MRKESRPLVMRVLGEVAHANRLESQEHLLARSRGTELRQMMLGLLGRRCS